MWHFGEMQTACMDPVRVQTGTGYLHTRDITASAGACGCAGSDDLRQTRRRSQRRKEVACNPS
jgi:hypothetical protein